MEDLADFLPEEILELLKRGQGQGQQASAPKAEPLAHHGGHPAEPAAAQEPAFAFIYEGLDGREISSEHYSHWVVVLNYWFSQCPPCVREIPELNQLVEEYRGKPVGFLAVSFDAPSQIEEFLREQPFHYRMARASVDELAASGIQSYPTHIVLDHNGIVVGRVSGLVGSPQEMKSKLKAWIDQALGASPHHRH